MDEKIRINQIQCIHIYFVVQSSYPSWCRQLQKQGEKNFFSSTGRSPASPSGVPVRHLLNYPPPRLPPPHSSHFHTESHPVWSSSRHSNTLCVASVPGTSCVRSPLGSAGQDWTLGKCQFGKCCVSCCLPEALLFECSGHRRRLVAAQFGSDYDSSKRSLNCNNS